MIERDSLRIRKRLLADATSGGATRLPYDEIDLVARASILYSSEDPAFPIENLLDGRSGRGATCWKSARPNTVETIIVEFDRPERIVRIIFDVEETDTERTQQITMDFSTDGGTTFQRGFVQEYTFSPHGSTYQREDLAKDLSGVTHLRLSIVPNKGGLGTAGLTSLRLFG